MATLTALETRGLMIDNLPGPEGCAVGPPTASASTDARKQKRFTLTLPIQTTQAMPVVPALESPVRSLAPSSTTSEDANQTATPTDLNFLTALAAQERRVLELKEELSKAEQVLHKLKKDWAIHEVQKKRQDIRRIRSTRKASGNAAARKPPQEEEPSQAIAQQEAERRRALHYRARSTQRKVFSGSRHARTLSLLSPEPTMGAFPTIAPKETPAAQAGPPIAAPVVDVVPQRREVGEELQPSRSHDANNETDISRDVLIRAGRQMATDFKDGLWTFLEDLRQVTVGEDQIGPEATATSTPRPRSQRSDQTPTTKAAHHRRAKSNVHSPGRVHKSKRTPQSSRRVVREDPGPLKHDEHPEEPSPKDSAVEFGEKSIATNDLIDVEAIGSPTVRKKTFSGHSTGHKGPTSRLDDADAWDVWESPQPHESTMATAISRPLDVPASGGLQAHESDFRSLLDGACETDENREPIPWPTLVKLTPGNLRRTASHLMSEWERTLSPPRPGVDRLADSASVKRD